MLFIAHHWFHWTEFTDDGLEQFHWFGLGRLFIPMEEITAVDVKVEWRPKIGSVPVVRFRCSPGSVELNPYLWGDYWIDDVVNIMKDHGIQADERLPLIQQTP